MRGGRELAETRELISAANDRTLERLVSSRSKLVDSFLAFYEWFAEKLGVSVASVVYAQWIGPRASIYRCEALSYARLLRPAALCKQSNDIRKIKLWLRTEIHINVSSYKLHTIHRRMTWAIFTANYQAGHHDQNPFDLSHQFPRLRGTRGASVT